MQEDREDPLKTGGIVDLVVFLLWATITGFVASQL